MAATAYIATRIEPSQSEALALLSVRNGHSVRTDGRPKSFEDMAVQLVKASVIKEPERKIAVGWYGQRTAAAHGRTGEVVKDEVGRMISGVRDFMIRHPA